MAKSGEVGKAGRWVNQTGRATRQSLEVGSATLPQFSGMASGLSLQFLATGHPGAECG